MNPGDAARDEAAGVLDPSVAAIVLAAGAGVRMGAPAKLLLEFAGRPLLAHAVEAAVTSRATSVVVVLGHAAETVREALGPRLGPPHVTTIENPKYREGLSGSLRAGLAAIPSGVDGVVVLLADMPRVRAWHVDRLIEAFAAGGCRRICVAAHRGRRGNPVLWPVSFLAGLGSLEGDTGGRALLAWNSSAVTEVEMTDDAVLLDVDVPRDLSRIGADTNAGGRGGQ